MGDWLQLIESAGIVVALFYTGHALRVDARVRRVDYLMKNTEHHRSIWNQVHDNPKITRVLNPKPRLNASPVTRQEKVFVTLIILHLTATLIAVR